ncbi:MAG: VWA domain-containing protein [Gammaproteobacteria bacterium]|nr:VWA domain-containing protein [Gammaproteobacteria bacterium]MCF6363985.1 VWA domain-containing protein [Gammaproteobacteria bacterium]
MPEQFHFLQPLWLLALIPLALLVWRLRRATTGDNPWVRIIDTRLQALLLTGQTHRVGYLLLALLGLGWLLAVLALANPAWEKQPRPLFQTSSAQVIVLDLSRSMLNRDLKPSRLARARFKIEDILARDEEGQTGLVVFAGDAFTVTPLTRDVDTIRALLTALDPELMPVQGSRADLGLQKAGELLQQAGLSNGQILLLADGVSDDRASKVAAQLHSRGYRISVLGMGTEKPEPLTNAQGQLLRTRDGQLILPPLETRALQAVAEAGGGRYHGFSSDNNDIITLLTESGPRSTENPISGDLQGQDWQSRGPWLVILLLPLAALAFRRGWLLSIVLLIGVLSPSQPVMATGWDDLWQRPDQQATRALAQKDYERASQIAEDPLLRGIAEYRRGNYEQALENFSQASGVTADYDRGNALAKLGRYEEAIAAYDNALKSAPDMEDAQANKATVEALLRQQQAQEKDPSQDKDGEENKENNGKQGQQDQQPQQGGQGEQSQQDGNPQAGEPSGQDKQSEQGETQPKNTADKRTFADAAKALEEEETEKGAPEEQQPADHTVTEEQPERQAGQQTASDEPSSRQQTPPADGQPARAETLSSEEQLAAEQWLRRIPDDPGGLLRRKFLYQYQQRPQSEGTGSPQPW